MVRTETALERELNSLYLLTAIVVMVIVTITFGSLIVAFLWRSQNGYLWEHLCIPPLLWVTTAILGASSLVLERSRLKLKEDGTANFRRLVKWTAALGGLFLAGQGVAWWQVAATAVLARDKHAWFVFLFSALHGLHILAGLGGLGYLLYRSREAVSGPRYQMTTRAYANALAIFWHYLGLLWAVLFALLLTWRR